jgi:predicted small lipoprotein YifL
MKSGTPPSLRRFVSIALAGILMVVLAACTGRGGGYLPPDGVVFTGPASFGFDFSCERSSRSTSTNPPTGQLRIQLAYTDHGSNPIGSWFSIHGIVDTVDPVLESVICIGQNPPEPDPNELIFLGRYRLLSSAPAGFPSTCPARETKTTPLCRFEVIVRDNDMNRAPSTGDYFQIRLSSGTVLDDELDPATVFYTRAGLLAGGNLTVD